MDVMDVLIKGSAVSIDREVFTALLADSFASTYAAYRKALATGKIAFKDLVYLGQKGEIPYALFFAPLPLVQAQVSAKTTKLLAGVTKDTFSVNSRDVVNLREIELIVKDLLRKQEFLKRHDSTLSKNWIVGLLGRPSKSIETDAKKLMGALGVTRDAMRAVQKRDKMLSYLINRLEENQILVSQSSPSVMPQRLKVNFSGITVKDNKVPYIFLAGGSDDYQEPVGRRIFTLTLLAVLVARKIFAPVTYDGSSTVRDVQREYDIAAEILMPASELHGVNPASLESLKAVADEFKVTPSAMVVRAMRLKLISAEVATAYLGELRREYERRSKTPMRTPKVFTALRNYNGRELSVRMLDALDTGIVTRGDFCRIVCLNKIKPAQIDEFRSAIK